MAEVKSEVQRVSRSVSQTILSVEQDEGDGARVRRSIGRPEIRNFDPFLMLDEFDVSPPAGFPDHPHRGFETVTYMLEGAFVHEDFCGHKGTINQGDLQWMTAGRGIVHSEMPLGNRNRGLQLWVNLAAKDKMVEPKYQELLDKDIPRGEKNGVKVKVIAGEAFGVTSQIYTRTPTMYLDFVMGPNQLLEQSIPKTYNAFVYTLSGNAYFGAGATSIGPHHTVVLDRGGEYLKVETKEGEGAHFVLIAGLPLNEPVVQYGPFVMNNRQEIQQAFLDYQTAKNGFENATTWSSRN